MNNEGNSEGNGGSSPVLEYGESTIVNTVDKFISRKIIFLSSFISSFNLFIKFRLKVAEQADFIIVHLAVRRMNYRVR